jgi:hypothetical protein
VPLLLTAVLALLGMSHIEVKDTTEENAKELHDINTLLSKMKLVEEHMHGMSGHVHTIEVK